MGNCNWINNNNNNPYNTTQPCNTNTCNTNSCNTNTSNTPSTNDCCCCPESMKKALGLISNTALADYIDFTNFAFVLSNVSVGGALTTTIGGGTNNPSDNLSYDTPATFQCVECNLVRITTTPVYLYGEATPIIDVNYLSLCDLAVAKFSVDEELFTTSTTATNECYPACNISSWASFKSYFRSLLDKKVNGSNCQCCSNDCCCENDILNKVNSCIAGSRGPTVSLIANGWVGEGLEVLGKIGCVLVLTDNNTATASPDVDDPNIFFVCLDKIGGFLA